MPAAGILFLSLLPFDCLSCASLADTLAIIILPIDFEHVLPRAESVMRRWRPVVTNCQSKCQRMRGQDEERAIVWFCREIPGEPVDVNS